MLHFSNNNNIIDGVAPVSGRMAPFVFIIMAALVTGVLFVQFILLCNGLSIANKDV